VVVEVDGQTQNLVYNFLISKLLGYNNGDKTQKSCHYYLNLITYTSIFYLIILLSDNNIHIYTNFYLFYIIIIV